MIRGIFLPEEDSPYWRKETESFENKIPRFDNKDECIEKQGRAPFDFQVYLFLCLQAWQPPASQSSSERL